MFLIDEKSKSIFYFCHLPLVMAENMELRLRRSFVSQIVTYHLSKYIHSILYGLSNHSNALLFLLKK